jgi:hypothetical protein
MRQQIGLALLQLEWQVPTDRDDAFNRWYDYEHLSDMVAVPGFLGGRRFWRVDDCNFASPSPYQYLTLYQLESEAALYTEAFQKHVSDPSPWTRDVAMDLPLRRSVYQQLRPERGAMTRNGPVDNGGQALGRALLQVMIDAEPECEDEFHGWYDEEHLPALVAVPGILSARRFVRIDDGGQDRRFLAVYELENEGVVTTAAFMEAGARTPRREKLGDRVTSQVQLYRQVFPVEGEHG